MIKVSECNFYIIISRMNVHPHSERESTQWEDLRNRKVIGRSTHGWLTKSGEKEEFFISKELAAAAGITLVVEE